MPQTRFGHDLRQRLDSPRHRRIQSAPNATPALSHLLICQVIGVIPKKVIRVRRLENVHA